MSFVFGLAVVFAFEADPKTPSNKEDLATLQGEWVVESMSVFGKTQDTQKGRDLVIDGNVMRWAKHRRLEAFEVKFEILASVKPKEMSFPGSPSFGSAIYECDADHFRLCIGQFPRPKEFLSKEGLNQVVYKFERKSAGQKRKDK